MSVVLSADHEHAKWMESQGVTGDIYIHTTQPGYTIRYGSGSSSTMIENGGWDFYLSGSTLKYKRGGNSAGSSVSESVYGFTDDVVSIGADDGIEEYLRSVAGRSYDHGSVNGDFVDNPIGTIDTFFTLLSDENKTPYEKYRDELSAAGAGIRDEDVIDRFLGTEAGEYVSRYFKALNPNANDRTIQGYFQSKYMPINLHVGTIVEGLYGKYGIPTPPNLQLLTGSSINSSKASPYMAGQSTPNHYNRVSMMTVSNVGGYSGSNSRSIKQSNLPKVDIRDTIYVKPEGSVSVSSLDKRVYTNTDSHNHNVDGDSATDVHGGGSRGGDRVLNNNDGSYDSDTTTSTDSHNHYVDIDHDHSASFTGVGKNYSVNCPLNTSSSQSAFSVMQAAVNVHKYVVIY